MTGKNRDQPVAAIRTEEGAPEQGFLARWSQRKLEVDTLAPTPQTETRVPGLAAEAEVPESTDSELTDADMPPLESLGEDSDYRGFFSPKVSETLRKAALRKLFSQPRFNELDGLDDYAEDFTRFEPLGDLVTHEMQRMLESARKALEANGNPCPDMPGEGAGMDAEAKPGSGQETAELASGEPDLTADRDGIS